MTDGRDTNAPPLDPGDAAARDGAHQSGGTETTRLSRRILRYDAPSDLFAGLPQIAELTQHRPHPRDDMCSFIARVRTGPTPEDAITLAAFALLPRLAIWWAYECLRRTAGDMTPDHRRLMGRVADWIDHPDDSHRWRTMQEALFAPDRGPAVFLGLAVGWSGGPMAPNDAAPIPVWRAPGAVNAAILAHLAHAEHADRAPRLQACLDEAVTLFGPN